MALPPSPARPVPTATTKSAKDGHAVHCPSAADHSPDCICHARLPPAHQQVCTVYTLTVTLGLCCRSHRPWRQRTSENNRCVTPPTTLPHVMSRSRFTRTHTQTPTFRSRPAVAPPGFGSPGPAPPLTAPPAAVSATEFVKYVHCRVLFATQPPPFQLRQSLHTRSLSNAHTHSPPRCVQASGLHAWKRYSTASMGNAACNVRCTTYPHAPQPLLRISHAFLAPPPFLQCMHSSLPPPPRRLAHHTVPPFAEPPTVASATEFVTYVY